MIQKFKQNLIKEITKLGLLSNQKDIEDLAHLQSEHLLLRIFKEKVKKEIQNKPIVAFLGGAYIKENTPAFDSAVLLGKLLAQNNIASISGGGPGIMTACLNGAEQGGMSSIAIKLNGIPSEAKKKVANLEIFLDNIAPRQSAILDLADVHIFCPGGVGTLYEFGESATMNKILKYPKPKLIILLDEESEAPYWQNLNELGQKFTNKGMIYLPLEATLSQILNSFGDNLVLQKTRDLYKDSGVLSSQAIDLLASGYQISRDKICAKLWNSFVINLKIGKEQEIVDFIKNWLTKNR
jgi:predicted Rossmann-fold nucleotide-binding protein